MSFSIEARKRYRWRRSHDDRSMLRERKTYIVLIGKRSVLIGSQKMYAKKK